MTAKKRWFPKIQTEIQEIAQTISWNSSSSSDEDGSDNTRKKKFKPYFPKFQDNAKPMTTSLNIKQTPISRVNNQIHRPYTYEDTSPTIPSISASSPSVSPILTQSSVPFKFKIQCEQDSPILSQMNHINREKSPVITNMELLNKIRTKRKCIAENPKIEQSSPDIFPSQATQVIEDTDSPDMAGIKTQDTQIEVVSSQDSSSIVVINSSSDNSTYISDPSHCYHHLNPRKKYCKKGGLLHQLQKSIHLQRSRVSLWHHDIYCKNIISSQTEHMSCLVKNKWKDFSCVILECCQNPNQSVDIENSFLVCLGHNIDSSTVSDVGQVINVFQPFKIKLVQFQNRKIKLFYNILKVLTKSEDANENVIVKNG
ncbi:hypothetical protein HHI36_013028 [Cryptolaemus montrouzieri]|uniref:Uncharacterized protein n=1 Tax=Cryptolaemus montrouzieri TaxID=559131 RepID=A0ABD2NH00_9CUCU